LVKKNLVANFLGQGWTALMGLAFIPVYIKYLGVEAYGLIGLFAILQGLFGLLDIGITPTLNREMARYTAGKYTAQSICDLLRSLEIVCLCIATVGATLLWSVSDWVASEWIQTSEIPVLTVRQAIAVMGFVSALRLIEGVYRGVILGLQKQVFFNVANAIFATFRALGAIAILAWWSPTVNAYFLWQAIVSVVSLMTFLTISHTYLPMRKLHARFSGRALMQIRGFAGGMLATAFLSLLLTQSDKILLSGLLSLESFAHYTLAGTAVLAISLLIAPITQAFYPRFTELISRGEMTKLIHSYHLSAQLVSVLAATPALIFMFFGDSVLLMWTGNSAIAIAVRPLLALLALGTLLNGIMQIPYLLTLADGWPSFAVWTNAVAVALLVPAIVWAAGEYGAIGAAWVLVVLNIGYVAIGIHFIHQRVLSTEKWRWYLKDVVKPLTVTTFVAILLSKAQPSTDLLSFRLAWLGMSAVCLLCAGIIASSELRRCFSRKIYTLLP
jgi:O-antigen/teichoic acid export membrane protein